MNIHGKSLSATILPIVGSLGKTCSGRFQSPTDFTPQKTGYSYSFFAQRCHENIIYLQCYATYNSTIEIYNYDINAATWKYMGSTITNSELDIANISKVRMDTGSTNLMTLVYTLPGGLVYEFRATETQMQLWKKPANGSYQQLWAK